MPARRQRRFISMLLAAALPLIGITFLAPAAHAAAGTLSFVGAASTAGNRTNHTVRIPTAVQAGDSLVMFLTTNATTGTLNNTVTGWTLLQSVEGNGTRGRAWARTATAADTGANVTATTSVAVKSVIGVSAYRSTAGSASVTASANRAVNTAGTSHATATVPVTDQNSWLVSYWSQKSPTAVTWALPAGTTSRTTAAGTGTGLIGAVVGDSNAAVATGTAAARTATTSASVSRSVMFSVVVSPGEDGVGPTNQAPTASFTSSCTNLACSFNAAASTDPDVGDVLTYSWNFGDATAAGTGVSPSHTYATPGARTVTLTVSDGTTTAQTTRTVNPTTTPAPVGPGHTVEVSDTVLTNMPRIATGEIHDLEYIGNRVFVVGGFTAIRNNATGNTTSYPQRYLAAFNLQTGLVDATFRPTFDGTVNDVEASPDGTKLFVAGRFNAVNGVTKRKFASINPTTGATVAGFTAHADGAGTELEATNTTVYLGGQYTSINSAAKRGLAAVDANTGALVGRTAANPGGTWSNDISGGIGPNGALNVQELKLTPDNSTLMVVHTGRQIAGQDRYGVGLINTQTGVLRPWRTRLWEDNLGYVGGVQRIFAGDIAPNGEYFVVSSGSGGDRPPINDTAVAFSIAGNDFAEPLWVSRLFDSVYSVAISEVAVYLGGHYSWIESPTASDPFPGLPDQGYGTGQGLSGYGLGDQVLRRDHVGSVTPAEGKALSWNPGSNSFEGNKAMLVTPRGVVTGGDATTQGGVNLGRLAVYNLLPTATAANETTITSPIEGRVEEAGVEFQVQGTARATSGVQRVQLELRNRDSNRYLQDDLTTWGTANTINVNLASPNATTTNWSLPLTIIDSLSLEVLVRTFAVNGTSDATKDVNKFETFSTADRTPSASISGPSGLVPSTSFTVTGSATDDFGVQSISYTIRDSNNRYLQNDGSATNTYNGFNIAPDVVGATSTTWSFEVTVPYEDDWKVQVTPRDTAGQSSLDSIDRTWTVTSTAIAPTVVITAPVAITPPATAPPLSVVPGSRMTFSGSANDDENLRSVEIQLRNSATQENLTADGIWGVGLATGWFRITNPIDLGSADDSWSWTTPFNLSPGTYSFTVRATDDLGLTTSSTAQGRLTINAQIAGDAPPNALLDITGTQTGGQTLDLNLTGTATDDIGVASVRVVLRDQDTNRYLQPNGSMGAAWASLLATLASPNGTSTTWALPVTLPTNGDWSVTAFAVDTMGQQDPSSTGATARYPLYPGDLPPVVSTDLLIPTNGAAFNDGRIVTSGRVDDDHQIQAAQVAVVDSLGRFMSSTGTFTSTTESWRTAFLNSPGSPGSNYSYTTPVIPAGTYVVRVRGVDQNDLATNPTTDVTVTVTQPSNSPPVASFTVSCNGNICGLDGRSSTDENVTALTYSWTSGGTGTSTGSFVSRTYTAAATYPVTLTVRDEYGLTATSTQDVIIVEPAGNVAPTAVIDPVSPTCNGLVCSFSTVGTADPNVGDLVTRLWTWGDLTPNTTTTSTSTTTSHSFAAPGTYTVSFTATDGWGNVSNTVTRTFSLIEPAGNVAPSAVISNPPTCTGTVCSFSSAFTTDADGDSFTRLWSWGDGTPDTLATSTTSPTSSHTFAAPGTSYTVTLIATDVWGNASAPVTLVFSTPVEPASNAAPTAVMGSTSCTGLLCTFPGTSTADPNGDPTTRLWVWGDGTPNSTTTSATPSHTYLAAGTYTVTFTVRDIWGKTATEMRLVTVAP